MCCRGRDRLLRIGLHAQVRRAERRPALDRGAPRVRIAVLRGQPDLDAELLAWPAGRVGGRVQAVAHLRRTCPRRRDRRVPERMRPEPWSTARRTAAGPLPPSQIGMLRIAGGLRPTSAKCSRPSSAVTRGSVQSRCSSGICWSMRLPRVWKSSPSASYSSGFQPTPSPSRKRPPESMSTSAACLAASAVWRCGRMMMPGHELDRPRAGGDEPEQDERLVERLRGVVVPADDVVERDDVLEALVLGGRRELADRARVVADLVLREDDADCMRGILSRATGAIM